MPVVDVVATGQNIRDMMAIAGKTAKDIQNACGLTTCNAVYKWMHGACMPTIDNIVIIADMCGVTINDIVITKRV